MYVKDMYSGKIKSEIDTNVSGDLLAEEQIYGKGPGGYSG